MRARSEGFRFIGRRAAFVAALLLVAWAPVGASAATITVDSTAEEADAAPGGGCATAGDKCTLRAAIEVSNASTAGSDEIVFDTEVFDGQAADRIDLVTNLPHIVEPARIDGGECMTEMGVLGPCVAIKGTNNLADGALTVEADGVAIEGVALGDAAVAIEVFGEDFEIIDNWFGTWLDGNFLGASGASILVAPGGGNGRIGGKEPGEANTFVAGAGVSIRGGSHVRLLGNTFGFTPEGETTYLSGGGISVFSAPGHEAVGNEIGTRLSPKAAATPACDGGCNLMSKAGGVSIGWGNDPNHGPPIDTTVRGNNFGLDVSGTEVLGINTAIEAAGIDTVVGGPTAGDFNRINGAGTPILGGGRGGLAVEGNLIGVDLHGEILGPAWNGITVYNENPDEHGEVDVIDNVLVFQSSQGIEVSGYGATIVGNVVLGGWIGVFTTQDNDGDGSLIEDNFIAEAEGAGVMIENDANVLIGNEILGVSGDGEFGGVGIGVYARNKRLATGNVIGGDTQESENVISFNRDAAIVVWGVEETVVEVARNRGEENGSRFLLVDSYNPQYETVRPNGGIVPPEILAATATGAGGDAEPGALVRVFRKATPEDGELASFLGEAVTGPDGTWSLAYAAAIPGGTPIAATQTNTAGGTSELGFATTPAVGGGGPVVGPRPDTTAPRARIGKAPAKRVRVRSVVFRLVSEPGASFQCKLDSRPFQLCSSPVRYRKLALGRHRFEVRAVDAAGNVGPVTVRAFTILPRRR